MYQAMTEQRPQIDPLDILVLIIGNSVTALWLYMIATRGAIFPQISPTVQVVSLSFFELLTLLTALDLMDALRTHRWVRFLILGLLVWLVPIVFTVQVMQTWEIWIPFWLHLSAQIILITIYVGIRFRTDLPSPRRWMGIGIVVVVLLVVNQVMGVVDGVLAMGQAEVAKLRTKADRHVEQGEQLFERRDYVLAKEQFEKAVSQFPAHRVAQSYLGILYSRLGFHDEAVSAFQKVLTIEVSGRSRINLGLVFYQMGKVQDALQTWSEVGAGSKFRSEAEDLIEIARKQNKTADMDRWVAPAR